MLYYITLLFCMITIHKAIIIYAQNDNNIADYKDEHKNCEFWSSIGECDKNPRYMLKSCKKSCYAVNPKYYEETDSNANNLKSFYDIIETDLNGNIINFDIFKNKVIYILNVASYCGYTESNYENIRYLNNKYEKDGLITILAPCNSFGYQEPGDSLAIQTFTKSKGYQGIILSKAEVNGEFTRPSFKYLKAATNKLNIDWNFDGKFLINKQGQAYYVSQSDDLEKGIQSMLYDIKNEL